MRSRITGYDIANYARMLRSLHAGTILIVEGDKDRRVYERFINNTCCKLIYAYGKANALDAIDILEKGKFRGRLAILDSDFFGIDGIKPSTLNIILTDTHDLETMLLSSDGLERILSEFGSAQKIGKLNKPIRDILLERAVPIGLLRWISSPIKDNLCLNFKSLRYETFLDKTTLNLDIDKLINEVVANSMPCTIKKDSIKLKIATLKKEGHDPWQICSGHDLIEILSFGLKNTFGNNKAKKLSPNVFDSMLRIAYDYSHFALTHLYSLIKAWEQRNAPFKVLP
jgi:hypothetical protein